MTFTDKNIVESYLEGLSSDEKLELIERLAKSLKDQRKKKEKALSDAFGSWSSDKSAEETVAEIKGARKFKRKEIKF